RPVRSPLLTKPCTNYIRIACGGRGKAGRHPIMSDAQDGKIPPSFEEKNSMTTTAPWSAERPTALLVLADGTVIEGRGLGAAGSAVAEVCFNTALTGYQEILTDPSYAGQIVTFTFPHIGNVGANDEDQEDLTPAARHGAVGAIFKADVTSPSSYRAREDLHEWLKRRGIVAMSGIDTRALTVLIREKGMPNAVIAHAPDGQFDLEDLKARAAGWPG